ncbi:MAG: hypothetical protein ACT4OT_18485 [Acidobacteriota bacterium]
MKGTAMFENRNELAPRNYCFRCTNGCVHVVCGNVTLTMKPVDFLILAEAVAALRDEFKEESKQAGGSQAYIESLMM